MSERIRGSYDVALYRLTFTLLVYTMVMKGSAMSYSGQTRQVLFNAMSISFRYSELQLQFCRWEQENEKGIQYRL